MSDPIARWQARHAGSPITLSPNQTVALKRPVRKHKHNLRPVMDAACHRGPPEQHSAPPPSRGTLSVYRARRATLLGVAQCNTIETLVAAAPRHTTPGPTNNGPWGATQFYLNRWPARVSGNGANTGRGHDRHAWDFAGAGQSHTQQNETNTSWKCHGLTTKRPPPHAFCPHAAQVGLGVPPVYPEPKRQRSPA